MNELMLRSNVCPAGSLALNSGLVVSLMMTTASVIAPVRELFRVLHRFEVWSLVALRCVQTDLLLEVRNSGVSWSERMLSAPELWLLVFIAALSLLPWLRGCGGCRSR
ncbi:hypothetical protein [Lentzea sp. NPDC004782]|uniref:hypothetical protein n=1 Tax=Lentzea sp. NPDC004782 TaxID=3154458 RepID=UPI00339FF201